MKRILTILILAALTACAGMETPAPESAAKPAVSSAEALKNLKLGCFNVKGVNDPENGQIYYTHEDKLFKYVKIDKSKGDTYFCSANDAEKAGFTKAPEHFSGSVYFLIQCLHNEGAGGKCHDYVAGIYKSLEIYDKVCAANPSHAELADVVESYANSHKDAMDSGKYEGTTAALINEYPCGR